jgi:DNA polymerase IV
MTDQNRRKEVRKIIHLDMDAFYASVEIKDNPQLAGLPVVVGGNPQSRAVVAAASYKAREYGIHSAMPCSRAQRLCPDAVFLPPRFERYKEISRQIHSIFKKYTDLIEPLSLDEAWLDVTSNFANIPSATWVAMHIKREIKEQLNLTASAGVSYNKFLAKIASDERKPDGLFVITPENAAAFLESIVVRKIPGVGKVTAKKLQLFGIEKGNQLLEKKEDFLIQRFGKLGGYLYRIIRGVDDRLVQPARERKSVGIENTFAVDQFYGEKLTQEMNRLLDGLANRIKKAGKQARTVHLKVKFEDFKQITRSMTLSPAEDVDSSIRQLAHHKLAEICHKEFPHKKIRLLGVSLSNFIKQVPVEHDNNYQLDIFQFLNRSDAECK